MIFSLFSIESMFFILEGIVTNLCVTYSYNLHKDIKNNTFDTDVTENYCKSDLFHNTY